MPWPRPSIDTIYERIKADMESRVTSGAKIPRVSMLGIMALVFAGAIHLSYGFLVWLAKQLFIDTADGIGRERWANILGLPREAATYTTGEVSFTGTADYVVAAGTEIVSSDGYTYTTDDAYTINPASDPVSVTATEEGALYNSDDVAMSLSAPNPDVDSSVVVEDGFNDGQDIESVEAWVLRMLARFQNPPSSGNAGDYVRWARKSSTEIGKAWCLPLYLGDGTVGVVIAKADLTAVSSQTVTDATDYINDAKPIPADLYILNSDPVNVDFEIDLSSSDAALLTQIEENIRQVMLLEAGPGSSYAIPVSHIHAAITAAGPYDYELVDIEVNSVSIGVSSPIQTTGTTSTTHQVPVFNSISFGAL